MRNPRIADLIEKLKTGTMEEMLAVHGGQTLAISSAFNDVLMMTLGPHDQVAALAFTLAAIHAAHEDTTCEADKDGFVTEQDRLDIFLGIYRIALNDAIRINRETATPSTETRH